MAGTRRGRTLRPEIPTARQSLAIAFAVLVALGGLNQLLEDALWWLVASAVVVLVVVAIAAVRYGTRRRLLPTAAGAAALLVVLTLFFAADTALLWLIPTPASIGRFVDLLASGGRSIQDQGVPATAVPGIIFILGLSSGLVVLAIDAVTVVARAPALAGIPLLAVVAAPGFIDPEYTDPFFFVLAGAAWLVILFVSSQRTRPGVAVAIGSIATVAALVVPLALPAVESVENVDPGKGYATGLNPFIDLGDDLRRPDPVVAMTYTTTSGDRPYLRMVTLGDFTDAAWEPTIGSGDSAPTEIDKAPGRADDVAVVESTATISMGNVRGRWLPVPYAATSVTGLVGTWVADPETLNVRSERSTVRGQDYVVTSEVANPTSDQLRTADSAVPDELEQYVTLPASLPSIVAEQALSVTAGATTNYDRAIALQSYFRGGEFTYSEDAPVENNYDGTDPEVIGEFLTQKSGYCVHFSSAMAAMARTLGIPARVAVGFTAGTDAENATTGEEIFTVTTNELHAWPELYFANVGWVRFEPTVGRTNVPQYNDAVVDDPATPNIDESTATPAATDAPQDVAPERDDSAGATGSDVAAGPDWNTIVLGLAALALLAVLAIPALARVVKRRARVLSLRHGSALGAWEEVRDTALDLGWHLTDAETPREFVARLTIDADADEFGTTGPIGGSPVSDPVAVAALERLRSAIETQSFARAGGDSHAPAVAVTPADLHSVLREMRSGVDWRVRLRAALAPASVLLRWFAIGARWRK